MRVYQGILLCSVLWASSVPRSCDHRAHDRSLQELAHNEKSPKIVAAFQPWFGDPDHIRIDYTSNDPSVIHRQIREAKSLGIYAFAVDWYASRHPFLDRSYAIIQQIASQEHFHVALMYDETEENNGHATEDALDAFDMAYKRYIGPGVPARDAYLLYQGRPVIFIFPKRGNTDWNQVRQMVSRWEAPPLLIYKDEPPPQYVSAFDGQYAWVHPGSKGWSGDGKEWGEEYLEAFYKRMQTKHPDQIAIGTIWPGFDDTRASWSLNRHIDTRCGKTLEDTLRVFEKNDDPARPMPFLLIATWNDYEEGTAIENGVARCSATPTPHS
jgi:hypothetical protein